MDGRGRDGGGVEPTRRRFFPTVDRRSSTSGMAGWASPLTPTGRCLRDARRDAAPVGRTQPRGAEATVRVKTPDRSRENACVLTDVGIEKPCCIAPGRFTCPQPCRWLAYQLRCSLVSGWSIRTGSRVMSSLLILAGAYARRRGRRVRGDRRLGGQRESSRDHVKRGTRGQSGRLSAVTSPTEHAK
jgi:hypothetical protein